MTADAYLQHQSNKHSNIRTDPLAEILNNSNKNPIVYANRQTLNINNKDKQYNEQMKQQNYSTGDKSQRTMHKKGRCQSEGRNRHSMR